MSDKLTKAQQAAEPKKRKKMTVEEDAPKELSTQRSVAAIKKEMAAKKGPGLRGDATFPLRYAIAVLCAVVLLVFVSVLLSDEGVVLQVVVNVFCGLFGRNVYYISMFALCYLICILLLSKGKPVRGRSGSIVAFVFLFGCARCWQFLSMGYLSIETKALTCFHGPLSSLSTIQSKSNF